MSSDLPSIKSETTPDSYGYLKNYNPSNITTDTAIEKKIDEDTLGWKWGKEFKITGIKIDKNGDFKVEIRCLKSSLCPEIFIFDKNRNFKGGCIEI